MPSNYRLHLRVIAFALLVCLSLQELAFAAPAASPVPALPMRFEAPIDFSSLKEIHRSGEGPFIIHIQDAHSNLSGQQNLAQTLDVLADRYGVTTVLVEGSSREVTLTPLRERASSKEICKRVAKSFLMEGKIAGEEYLNLTSDRPIRLLGIEDGALYRKSVENYAELADGREASLAYLKDVQGALAKLKRKMYPAGLLDYEKTEGKGVEASFKELLALAARQDVSLEDFGAVQALSVLLEKEKGVDFETANLEMAALIEEIGKRGGEGSLQDFIKKTLRTKGNKASQHAYFQNTLDTAKAKNIPLEAYPNLTAYTAYLKEFAEIDLDSFLEEKAVLEDRVYAASLAADKDARLVRAIDRYVALLVTAYRIQMTTKDFKTFKANEPDFTTLAYLSFINRRLTEQGYAADLIAYQDILEKGQSALSDFYASVDDRDLAFLQNTERILKEQGQEAVVLISGGYHTPHLKELFRQRGYSYAVLTPIVTSETNQAKYEKLLLQPLKKEVKEVRVVSGEGTKDKPLSALEEDIAQAWNKKDGVRVGGTAADGMRLAALAEELGIESIPAEMNTPENPAFDRNAVPPAVTIAGGRLAATLLSQAETAALLAKDSQPDVFVFQRINEDEGAAINIKRYPKEMLGEAMRLGMVVGVSLGDRKFFATSEAFKSFNKRQGIDPVEALPDIPAAPLPAFLVAPSTTPAPRLAGASVSTSLIFDGKKVGTMTANGPIITIRDNDQMMVYNGTPSGALTLGLDAEGDLAVNPKPSAIQKRSYLIYWAGGPWRKRPFGADGRITGESTPIFEETAPKPAAAPVLLAAESVPMGSPSFYVNGDKDLVFSAVQLPRTDGQTALALAVKEPGQSLGFVDAGLLVQEGMMVLLGRNPDVSKIDPARLSSIKTVLGVNEFSTVNRVNIATITPAKDNQVALVRKGGAWYVFSLDGTPVTAGAVSSNVPIKLPFAPQGGVRLATQAEAQRLVEDLTRAIDGNRAISTEGERLRDALTKAISADQDPENTDREFLDRVMAEVRWFLTNPSRNAEAMDLFRRIGAVNSEAFFAAKKDQVLIDQAQQLQDALTRAISADRDPENTDREFLDRVMAEVRWFLTNPSRNAEAMDLFRRIGAVNSEAFFAAEKDQALVEESQKVLDDLSQAIQNDRSGADGSVLDETVIRSREFLTSLEGGARIAETSTKSVPGYPLEIKVVRDYEANGVSGFTVQFFDTRTKQPAAGSLAIMRNPETTAVQIADEILREVSTKYPDGALNADDAGEVMNVILSYNGEYSLSTKSVPGYPLEIKVVRDYEANGVSGFTVQFFDTRTKQPAAGSLAIMRNPETTAVQIADEILREVSTKYPDGALNADDAGEVMNVILSYNGSNAGARMAASFGQQQFVERELARERRLMAQQRTVTDLASRASGNAAIAAQAQQARATLATLQAQERVAGFRLAEREERFELIFDASLPENMLKDSDDVRRLVDAKSVELIARAYVSNSFSAANPVPFVVQDNNITAIRVEPNATDSAEADINFYSIENGSETLIGSIRLTKASLDAARGANRDALRAPTPTAVTEASEVLTALGESQRLWRLAARAYAPGKAVVLKVAIDANDSEQVKLVMGMVSGVKKMLSQKGDQTVLIQFFSVDGQTLYGDAQGLRSDDTSHLQAGDFATMFMGVPNQGILSKANGEGAGFMPIQAEQRDADGNTFVIPYGAAILAAVMVARLDTLQGNDRMNVLLNSLTGVQVQEADFMTLKRVDLLDIAKYARLAIKAITKLDIDGFVDYVKMMVKAVGAAA